MIFFRDQRMIFFTSIAAAAVVAVVAAIAASTTFMSDSNGLADANRVSLHNLRRYAAIVQ